MDTILVTGAAGFIGSRVCKFLQSEGKKVIGVDNFSLGKPDNILPDIEFIQVDVSDSTEVWDKLSSKRPHGIIHLAGQSGGELSFSEPLFDLDSNVRSTLVLLAFAKEMKVRRLVHASSVAVYGNSLERQSGLEESAKKNPTSPYGVSKLASENYLEVLSTSHKVSTTSLRFFNVYGAGQDLQRLNQGMLSVYLSHALHEKKIPVKGSSERFRDFVHVDDAAQACLAALSLEHSGHVSINVCTGKRTFVWQALDILCEEFDFDIEIEHLGSTPGDVVGWVGDTRKLIETLSWKPERDFDSGFREMIRTERSRFHY